MVFVPMRDLGMQRLAVDTLFTASDLRKLCSIKRLVLIPQVIGEWLMGGLAHRRLSDQCSSHREHMWASTMADYNIIAGISHKSRAISMI